MKELVPFLFLFFSCKKSNTQTEPIVPQGYEKTPSVNSISGASVTEASGIADSRLNPGYLWVQEDSGNPPLLYIMGHDGAVNDSIRIEGAVNRDWEDICIAPGPEAGVNYVYLGDIGDNKESYSNYRFYRFAEPARNTGVVTAYDSISFQYPDSSHDSEAFVVDNLTRDIYIITKRDERSRIYRLTYPQLTAGVNRAEYLGQLNYTGVVGAALSPDGKELIVKTYTTLYYYTRTKDEALSATLATSPETLDYQQEAQGEAVTFASTNNGFFTLSEQTLGIVPTLNFYRRK